MRDLDKVVEGFGGCDITSEKPHGNNKSMIGYFIPISHLNKAWFHMECKIMFYSVPSGTLT